MNTILTPTPNPGTITNNNPPAAPRCGLNETGICCKKSDTAHTTPRDALRTITAITVLRDQVLAPLIATTRARRSPRQSSTWTNIEHDYHNLRVDMETLLTDLGIATAA